MSVSEIMPQADVALHAVVQGRVQGVGYRYFVMEEAARLGLRGWVRNLPNGTVEVMAQGPHPALDALLAALKLGPAGARVANIDIQWEEASAALQGFSVRRT